LWPQPSSGLRFSLPTPPGRTHRTLDERATERIERALDVAEEHSLKALQTIERTIAETTRSCAGFPTRRSAR
jgi:hypothetical protein